VGIFLDFIFVFYLFRAYGGDQPKSTNPNERVKNVWQRVFNIFCKDWVVFVYLFIFAFQIYWASQGYAWISKENNSCKDLKALTLAWILTIFFWVFVIVGFVIGFFTLLFMAIDEGSCSCLNLCYGCIFCCTCGICNPKISQQEQQRR
jgi:hypothetical protein